MKDKIFLNLVLLSLAASNSYAFYISNGKLINHTETVIGKAKASFDVINVEKDLFKETNKLKRYGNNTNMDTIILSDHIRTLEGIVGKNTIVKGSEDIDISNDTNSIQIYNITTKICVEEDCAESKEVIALNPHSYTVWVRWPSLELTFDKAGQYFTQMSTKVTKNNLETIFIANDMANLTIYASN